MLISVVVTVKNDEEGVKKLQRALAVQTRKPDEVIIIRAEDYGNCSRGEGRNIGIRQAKNNVIAVTDVGCTPHRDWLERLTNPLKQLIEGSDLSGRSDPSAPVVVAGFYHTITKTPFQQAIAPYLAVLPHRWSQRYLPASRSIAFMKSAWKFVGGYPEEARSGAEDLVFAARLAKHPDINLIHAPDALVDWEPPRTLSAFFHDMVKHTSGNIETRYWPHLVRNITVPFRWAFFVIFPWFIPFYLVWPIGKHRPGGLRQLLLLPIVQLVADLAIIFTLLVWLLRTANLSSEARNP